MMITCSSPWFDLSSGPLSNVFILCPKFISILQWRTWIPLSIFEKREYKIHNLVNKVLEKKVRNSSYFILFFMILGNQNSYIQFKCQKDQFLKGKFKNWMSICTKKKNTEWANHNKEFQDNWNIHIQLIKNTPH